MNQLFVIGPKRPVRLKDEQLSGERSRGDSINFDVVYKELIRPAAKAAGLDPFWIYDFVEPQQLTDQYLKDLLHADVVLADVSIPNANVYYELGIRQAVSTGSTILIALAGSELPFDLSNQPVIFYKLSPEELKYSIDTLTEALQKTKATENPIRIFLERIAAVSSPTTDSAAFEQELQGRIQRAQNREQLIAVWQWSRNLSPLPPFPLLSLAKRLSDLDEWERSVEVLKVAVDLRPNDFEFVRQLGWHLSKLPDQADEAIEYLERALSLNPDDPETLGMIAGVFKRKGDYKKAAEYYSKGATASPNSLYMRVNQAAMQIFLEPQNPKEGISLYHDLKGWILKGSPGSRDAWQELALAEAYFVIHKVDSAKTHWLAAHKVAGSPKSLRSAADQLEQFGKAGFKTKEALDLAKWLRSLVQESVEVSDRSESAAEQELPQEKLPVLLHLSDIHFGGITKDGKTKDMHRFHDGEYSRELSQHLIDEFAAKKAHFAHDCNKVHLLISGDITYTATKDEFQRAQDFLEEVCKGLSISKSRVHLVPGNHDVSWGLSAMNPQDRFNNYIAFLVRFYGEELFRERHPKITWDLKIDSKPPAPWEIVSIHHDPELRLTILGLNSCVYETDQNHYGVIGGRQLRVVEKLLDELDIPTGGVRVAMFHHHLHPFPEIIQQDANSQVDIDLSIIRDSGIVERQLEKMNFDLILHGHKHKPQIRETVIKNTLNSSVDNAKLIVCGAGSAGVNSDELEHNISNQYQVIEVLRSPRKKAVDFLRIEWRTLDVSPEAEWVTPGAWIVTG